MVEEAVHLEYSAGQHLSVSQYSLFKKLHIMSLRSKFRAGMSKCVYKHVVYSIPNFHALQVALFRLTQSPFRKYNILIFYPYRRADHGGTNGQQGKKDNPHHRAYRRGGGHRGRVHIYISRIPRRGKRGSQPRRIRFRSAGRHRRQRYHQRAYGEEPRRSA